MMRLLIVIFSCVVGLNYAAEPSPVYVEKAGNGYQVRVSGEDEQFKVVFPEEPRRIGAGKDGQIIYELDKEDDYGARYVFAYIYDPAGLGYPLRVTWTSVGLDRLQVMRKEVAERLVSRMMAFSGMGYNVASVQVGHEYFPRDPGYQGESFQYEVTFTSRYKEPVELTFRVYVARAGIYVVAMMGQSIHRFDTNDKFILADWRWHIPGAMPREEGLRFIPYLWQERPFADWRWHIPGIWPRKWGVRFVPYLWPDQFPFRAWQDTITWGKYGPTPFFDSAEMTHTQ